METQPTTAAAAPKPKPPTHIHLTWQGEHRFEAARADGRGAPIAIDASAHASIGPVDTLVSALASCTAVDVVDILAKRRTPVQSLAVDAVAERFNGTPARLTAVKLTYRITGAGIDRAHAERAIDLAVNKYCSVRDSLDRSIPVTWELELG